MHEAKCIKWRKQDRREESDQGLYSGMVFKWLGRKRVVGVSTKLRLVKAMVFPVLMYGCKSWSIKKAKCSRIDPFEL